jgi:hypothetical protein
MTTKYGADTWLVIFLLQEVLVAQRRISKRRRAFIEVRQDTIAEFSGQLRQTFLNESCFSVDVVDKLQKREAEIRRIVGCFTAKQDHWPPVTNTATETRTTYITYAAFSTV